MKTRKFISTGITAVILIIFFTACNKKPDRVGLSLQPVSDELSVVFDNSTGLLIHSQLEDSVRTDVNVIKTGMLGSMLDPVFGKTTAEIFSQFRLSENGHNFGTDPLLDSLVLSLSYSGFYGDSMSSQTIRVFELDQEMFPDTTYYSNQSLSDYGVELAAVTFVPAPGDSVMVGGDLEPPQLRIRLSDEFGQKIMDADPNVFDDNESWLEFMKGLHITSEPAMADGGIMLFDMFASNTALNIYYRTEEPQDTLTFGFLSNSNCARFTAFDHNEYSDASSEFKTQVLNGDTSAGSQLFYLQSMGGVKAQLRLPDIQEFFKDGAVAINEAKLIFNIYDDGSELLGPPQLGLAMIDEEGDYIPLPDAGEVSSYYGGYLNEAENQYYFRISRHVQQVLTGQTPNYPLALLITGASFRANRLILYGPDSLLNGDNRMILNVIYTKVN
ncbi:MAG: DUF4270 domain-containing protein [Bacteroidales bacterium]|nr:DUF4270 domain-containing protein [Bacteroidales bacterium]